MIQDDFDNNENEANVFFVNIFVNRKARDSISFILQVMNPNDIKMSTRLKDICKIFFIPEKYEEQELLKLRIRFDIFVLYSKSKSI